MIADGAKVYRDTEQKVPYLVQGDQWIGYDDKESFTEKVLHTLIVTSFGIHIINTLFK